MTNKGDGLCVINDPTILRGLSEKGRSDLDPRLFGTREKVAEKLDAQLRRLSRASASLVLLQGKLLSEIKKKGSEILGYTRIIDYAREELGISERQCHELLWMEHHLLCFPLFREAFEKGKLGISKVRLLLRNLEPRDEEIWLECAMGWSVRILEDCLRIYREKLSEFRASAASESSGNPGEGVEGNHGGGGSGKQAEGTPGNLPCGNATGEPSIAGDGAKESPPSARGKTSRKQAKEWAERQAFLRSQQPPGKGPLLEEEDEAPGEWIRIPASAGFREKWRRFLEIARRIEGKDLPPCGAVEYACADFLSGAPREAITGESGEMLSSLDPGAGHQRDWWREIRARWRKRRIEAAEEEERDLQILFDGWSFLSWEIPEIELPFGWESSPPAPLCESGFAPRRESGEDVHETHEMLKDIRSFKAGMHYAMICLLGTMKRNFLFRDLQFRSFEHYARERLGMPKSTAYRYAAISKELSPFPALVRAVSEDVLSMEKATLCGKISFDFLDDQWVSYAKRVPTVRLRRVVEILEDLRAEFNHAWIHYYQELPSLLIRCEEEASRELLSLRSLLEEGEARWMTGQASSPACFGSAVDDANESSESVPMCAPDPPPPSLSTDYQLLTTDPVCAPGREGLESSSPDPSASPCFSPSPSLCASTVNEKDRVRPIKFFLPGDLVDLWEQTIFTVRSLHGEKLTPAECLEILVESFLRNYEDEKEKKEHKIIERDGWRCTVPGCGNRWNLHVHHIKFRSQGGPKEPYNETTVCLMCHQRAIHKGYIKASGLVPGKLVWEMGVSPLYPRVARYVNGLADIA